MMFPSAKQHSPSLCHQFLKSTHYFSQMKFLFATLLALVVAANAFDSPNFLNSEEMRFVNNDYHDFVDSIVWNNAFQWSNCGTGSVNFTRLAIMQSQLTAKLSNITTSTFRQCDRLSATCYQCENGAANVSAASIGVLAGAKLYAQANDDLDSVSEKLDSHTFTLSYNTHVPVVTATLACRANATCFPCSYSQTIKGELQGLRKITFKSNPDNTDPQVLIHRINTGARYTYFSRDEAGFRILSVINGDQLVPESIMEDFSRTGVFCVSSKKRSIIYAGGRIDYAIAEAEL